MSAQLVVNGSFENFTRTFGIDGGAALNPDATTLTGSNLVVGEIAPMRNPIIQEARHHSVACFLDLMGYSDAGLPNGISQNLTGLSVGQTYTFSMWLGLANGVCGELGQM